MADTKVLLPRIDTTTYWTVDDEEESMESRLLSAIADVLGLVKEDIQLFDSFTDLGGDQRTAMVLRRACMDVGMSIKTKDILRCETLAELQTCITPCARQSACSPSVEGIMIAPLEIHKASRLSIVVDDNSPHSRSSSKSSSTGSGQQSEVEAIITSCKGVSRAVVLRPKAGLLDGRLVGFLTLATTTAEVEAPGIHLIPQSQMIIAGTQVATIREKLEAALPIEPIPDTWIVLEGMPLLESGNIDRRKLRTWIQNINETLLEQATSLDVQEPLERPSTEMERTLQRLVSRVLQIPQEQIGVNFSFTHLGGDEMSAMELVVRCKHESIYLNATEVQTSTLSELAALAAQRGGISHKWSDESLEFEFFDLSPMQSLYFQTAMGGDMDRRAAADGTYRFNQSLLVRIKKNYGLDDICAAVEAVVGHHAMLRSRFSRVQGRWRQRILSEVSDSYPLNHHSVASNSEVEAIIARTQATIDVENGPVFAVDHIETDDGHQMIYLAAHHIAVDLISWRVILHDLDELMENGSLLSQRSMPFQKWNEMQKEDAQNLDPSKLLPFDVPFGDYTYWGLHGAPNTYGDAKEASFSLSPELTTILQTSCNQVFRTDSVDIFLAALLLSFSQTFTDRRVPAVWNQDHGRETWSPDIDISETVGWFTSICPISQEVVGTDDFIEVLRRVKDTRKSIPTRGSQYFASKFFNVNAPNLFAREWPFEIIFSYAGSFQQLDREHGSLEQLSIPCKSITSATSDIGPNVGRIALFEISAMIDQGHAKVKILYNRYSKHQEAISRWINNFEHLILEAIGRLRFHSHELTLSDVPHLKVSYSELAKLNRERVTDLSLTSPRDIENVFPITPMQQGILISQAKNPENCHLHAIYEFTTPTGDPVDTSRICAAWQHVTTKHAALRTIFIDSVTHHGLFDQVVLRKCSPNMLFIDTAPHEDSVEELTHLPHFKSIPSLPHHRLTVCKAPTKTFVKLDISGTLCDGTSIHILFADLRRAYATGKAIHDPATFSYPKYMASVESNRQKSLDFCAESLRGVQPCLFPMLNLKRGDQQRRSRSSYLELDVSVKDLTAFAKAQKLSTAAILRLAWGLILRATVGKNDICFGFQTTGRDASAAAARGAVGCFANTIACTMDLSPYKSLDSALKATEEQYNSFVSHQHASLSEIHHALGLKGGDGLFNTCLSFIGESADLNSRFTTRTNFELRSISLWETSEYDVAANTHYANGMLAVDMSYRIMSPDQALCMMKTFGRAIQAIIGTRNGSIGGVDLFCDGDYAQIVNWGSNDSLKSVDRAAMTLPDLIYVQSIDRPDAQAVCAWDGDLAYWQLEEHATKLAHYLVGSGIRPSAVVPVVLEKSRWAVVAMFAVLKVGAAFVLVDAEELSLLQPILALVGANIVISSKASAGVLQTMVQKVIVLTDDLMTQLPRQNQALLSTSSPKDLACVLPLPTSSKDVRGIAFSHETLSATFLAQGPAARISSQSRVMQLSSFNVDIALAEIFTTLVHGGCVCIPSSKERLQNFTGASERMKVNWSYMTPLLSRKLDPQLLPSLKAVCFRTRSLDEDTYNAWSGKANVILSYGTADVCPLAISFLEVIGPHHLNSIARPFAGSFWIVNPEDHRRLMPIGTVGELVIEGPTLGIDYPLNGQSWQHLNSATEDGQKTRYFKTGHRVRYTEGGLLEFISSKRDDLEIGGKMVVLSELEQQVRRCLGQGIDVMIEAMAFRGAKETTVLAAFIELGDALFDGPENLSQLSTITRERVHIAQKMAQNGLRKTLPPHLIPSIFIPVKHLPVTPSLKVNRRKLQKMIHGLSREQLMALATVRNPENMQNIGVKPLPLTQAEERMRGIWARVLNVHETTISAGDSLFGAGGDDVSAAQLMVACRHEGITISMADVLRNASLTELCRGLAVTEETELQTPEQAAASRASPLVLMPTTSSVIDENFIEKVIGPKVGVQRSGIKDIAEASSMQTRYIESGMLRGRANIDYFVFSLAGPVSWKKVEEACQMLATIHPIMRTAFVPHNRKVYQVVLKSFNVEFKRYTCPGFRLASMGEKVIAKDQHSQIAFCAPLTKFIFLDAGKQSTLIMRLSKAQYDNMSIALLVKDFKKFYDGTENPPRRPTYCDFMRCAQIPNGAEEYWRTLLDRAVVTQVFTHSKPYQMSKNTKTIRNRMPVGPLSSLGISFETVLKAAWAMVLASLSGSSDIVFGEMIEGRHVRLPHGQSVSGVLGPTTNIIPVRVCFPDAQLTPLALLQYVHSQRIASIPFENLGFLNIVEKCTPWPYWTRFSTVVQHQHEDITISPQEPKTFHLGSMSCKLSVVQPKSQDASDVFVHSIMRGGGKVEIGLTYCQDRIPSSFADEALRMLCSTIHLLTSVSIMQPAIPSAAQYHAKPRAIPLGPPTTAFATPANTAPKDLSSLQANHMVQMVSSRLPPEHALAIQACIARAWATVLDPRSLGVPEDNLHKAAFYDLWGSLIPAAQLASHLHRELPRLGVPGLDNAAAKISMEDMVDHPTMLQQFELVERKMRENGGKGLGQALRSPLREKAKAFATSSVSARKSDPIPSSGVALTHHAQASAVPTTDTSAKHRVSKDLRVNTRVHSHSHVRHKSVPLSSSGTITSAISLGKGFRQLASSVTRPDNGNGNSTGPSPANGVNTVSPETPHPSRDAAPARDVSPMSPLRIITPASPDQPRPPHLPAFSPVEEIVSEEMLPWQRPPTTGSTSSDAARSGTASEAASLTEGSSASSSHGGGSGDEREGSAPAPTKGRGASLTLQVPVKFATASTTMADVGMNPVHYHRNHEPEYQDHAGNAAGDVGMGMVLMRGAGDMGEDIVSPLSAAGEQPVHFYEIGLAPSQAVHGGIPPPRRRRASTSFGKMGVGMGVVSSMNREGAMI